MSYDEHQAMWPQMIAALAAIDEALGLPADGCNSTAQTLAAISSIISRWMMEGTPWCLATSPARHCQPRCSR